MPCRYEIYPEQNDLNELNYLTQLLCIVCKYIEFKKLPIPPEVGSWWEAHKKADLRRELDEKEEKKNERKKKAALKKLTAEEKEILGVDE